MRSWPLEDKYSRGLEAFKQRRDQAFRRNLIPPPDLSLSEWGARHGVLSRETSAKTGRFEAYAYQPGIMDAITDQANERVAVMKAARVGFTKILDMTVGYYIEHEPSPTLVVQPRVEDAEDYSKTEIAPMLRDTPALAAQCSDPKAKNSGQTILKKSFLNGASLSLVGANSPGGFRRITVRVVLFDEVDGYPVGGAGAEGDQIALGIKRSETFWNRRIVQGSTPTRKGESRIEKSFEQSDQRYFFVPCPHCGEKQVLEWGGKKTPHGIKWKQDENGQHLPDTAYYVCKHNGCVIEESDKEAMVSAGAWQATKPFLGHAGFHIWAAYSLNVNAAWGKLVKEWLEVKADPLRRQTFVNLVLGLPYEDRGIGALNERTLAARAEKWDAEVPDGVAIVTCGIDVQDDRVELEFTGWGRDEESWSIDHQIIEGDPDTAEVWDQVDAALKRTWYRADGRPFATQATCIDSGGHHTQAVYNFSQTRLSRKVWAIKGESAQGGARSPVWPTKRPSARNKKAFRPIIIGVNAAKDVIRSRLHITIPPEKAGQPMPGYMHFPIDRDVNYFAQLVAERSVLKMVNGKSFRVWEQLPGRANEALDCRVYAYAALCGLLYFGTKLNMQADRVEAPYLPKEVEVVSAPVVQQERVVQGPVVERPTVTITTPEPKKRARMAGKLAGA